MNPTSTGQSSNLPTSNLPANAVNCYLYATDGTTCIKGQYLRGDGAIFTPNFNSLWTAQAVTASTTSGSATMTAAAGTFTAAMVGAKLAAAKYTFVGNTTAGSTALTITSASTTADDTGAALTAAAGAIITNGSGTSPFPGAFKGTLASGSTTVTVTSGTVSASLVGDLISGTGIPANAMITGTGSGTLTISAAATSTVTTAETVTITPLIASVSGSTITLSAPALLTETGNTYTVTGLNAAANTVTTIYITAVSSDGSTATLSQPSTASVSNQVFSLTLGTIVVGNLDGTTNTLTVTSTSGNQNYLVPGAKLTAIAVTAPVSGSIASTSLTGGAGTIALTANSTAAVTGATFLFSATGGGSWIEGANNAASSSCASCHHGSPASAAYQDTNGTLSNASNSSGMGPNYFTTGHKNMLRKAAPGEAWTDWSGTALSASGAYNWGSAPSTYPTYNGNQLYYIFGWISSPDAIYANSTSYGGSTAYQCARCHTTGYRFDALGPEPTLADGITPLTQAQFNRSPGDGAAGTTASWYLTGIQCERCHKEDMQVNVASAGITPTTFATGQTLPTNYLINSVISKDVTAGGRVGHEGPSGTSFPSSTNVDGSNAFIPVGSASTALCIECHRQETDTKATVLPTNGISNPVGGTGAVQQVLGSIHPDQLAGQQNATMLNGDTAMNLGPVSYKTLGTAPSMSHGANGAQAFLSSPHARYTGIIDQTVQNSPDLSVTLPGTYNSDFVNWGEANGSTTAGASGPATIALDNGGCAGCHDVHNSTLNQNLIPTTVNSLVGSLSPTATDGSVLNTTNVASAFQKRCVDCHAGHSYSTNAMVHPTGANTPFANDATDPNASCVICHLAGASGTATYHFFAINPNPAYSTFTVGQNVPNTFTDSKGYTGAVALDVDMACGQCHGGGATGTSPYGLVPPAAGIPVLNKAALAQAAVNMHGSAASAPVFTPASGQLSLSSPLVTISLPTSAPGSGVAIYYTTDGSTPTAASSSLGAGGSITYVAGQTINAIVAPIAPSSQASTLGCYTTFTAGTCFPASLADGTTATSVAYTEASAVTSASYSLPALQAPTFSPSSGSYTFPTSQLETLSDTTSGVSYCYTTNGVTPVVTAGVCTTGQTVTPFPVVSGTIKAFAIIGTSVSPMATSSAFTVRLATPTFSATGNLPTSYHTSVSHATISAKLTDTDSSATICYTLNGTTPTATVAGTCDVSATEFSAATLAPVAITASETVHAIATAAGATNSAMTSGTYTLY